MTAAEYEVHFAGLVAAAKARREANTSGVSAEEKAALLREKFEQIGDDCRREDLREQNAIRERNQLGSY